MTNHKSSRRKLLKSIAASSGAMAGLRAAPESWTRPVVDCVILPVHATTTNQTGDLTTVINTTTTTPMPCCDIKGTYCGFVGDIEMGLTIVVQMDGSILITVEGVIERELGSEIAETEVPCYGGYFEIQSEHGNFSIAGTVNCNQTLINGVLTDQRDNSVQGYNYTASITGCSTDN